MFTITTDLSFVNFPYVSHRLHLKERFYMIKKCYFKENVIPTYDKNPQINGKPDESPVLFF